MTVLQELLQAEFSFEAIEIKKIGGYDNANYVVTGDSNKYIFKTLRQIMRWSRRLPIRRRRRLRFVQKRIS